MSGNVTPPYRRLAELVIGSRVALALRVAAERRIADLLADGPKTAEALAADAGLPAASLRRLLRALAALGVFDESADGKFSNTDVSAFMRDGASPSLREMILILNDDAVLKGWQQFPAVLESGEPAFAAANGMTFFQHVASDPKRSELMSRFMAGIYGPESSK